MRARPFAFLLALAVASVATGDVSTGEQRSVQSREGSVLRVEPKPLAKRVTVLPYGSRVSVTSTRERWAQVSADGGQSGWVRQSDIVEPGALTGAASATALGSSEVSLAGRQFDETTEGELRASEADLNAAYALVNELEKKTVKPGSPELDQFIAEGRLGQGGK
jgi:hypothetical protein